MYFVCVGAFLAFQPLAPPLFGLIILILLDFTCLGVLRQACSQMDLLVNSIYLYWRLPASQSRQHFVASCVDEVISASGVVLLPYIHRHSSTAQHNCTPLSFIPGCFTVSRHCCALCHVVAAMLCVYISIHILKCFE